jgi:hypothetical protein
MRDRVCLIRVIGLVRDGVAELSAAEQRGERAFEDVLAGFPQSGGQLVG